MKKFLVFNTIVLFSATAFAQDSIPPFLKGKISYPAINTHPYMGVVDVEFTALKYNPKIDYKVAIDVYDKSSDSTQLNGAIREVARTYNLNLANGVPKEKLQMAVVIHGGATNAVLNEEAYLEKYGVENPNLETLAILKELGVDFYICSQSLGMKNIPPENIIRDVEVALSAKTSFITLDQLGYTYLNVNSD